MRRQFPIVLLVAVITAVVALTAAKDSQSSYEGRESLLFVSSPSAYDDQGHPINVNPLNLSGNGERVASSAVLAMGKSPGFKDDLRSAGATGDVKFRRTADAILEVRSSAKTPAAALSTLNTAVFLVSSQLNASQAASGAPPGTFLKIETLASTDRAREIDGSPMKSIGAIVVVGIVVAVAAALALDAAAPNGFRSGARWMTRSIRRAGGRVSPAPGGASSAPRPTGGAPPSAPVPPAPAQPVSAPPAPTMPAPPQPAPKPAEPVAQPASPAAPAPPKPAPAPQPAAAPAPQPSAAPAAPAPTPPKPALAPQPSAAPAPQPSVAPAPAAPAPASQATARPGPAASTPGAGNRQMRREAARAATRTRGREPMARSTPDLGDPPRPSRSV